MEEKNITMADLIAKVIQNNQLAGVEEDMILEMLKKRKQERYEKQGCRCIAEYAEKEMGILAEWKEQDIKEKSGRLCRLCLRESRIGNMDITELTAADIRKLIILTAETRILDRKDMMQFLVMLQHTLNVLSQKGILGFNPSGIICSENQAVGGKATFMDNPYTIEEVRKITEWIDSNPHDMRGLAVGLWLASDISPEEIVSLKKENLMNSDGVCTVNPTVIKKNETEDYISITERRRKIVSDALDIHAGRDLEYIFMSEGRDGWKKMLARCLPLKMSHICRDIDITYKPFRCADAIRWHAG